MAEPKLHTGPLHLIVTDTDKEKRIINADGEIIFDKVEEDNPSVHLVIKEYYDEYNKLQKYLNEVSAEWTKKYIDKDKDGVYSNDTIVQNNKNHKIYTQKKEKLEAQLKALKKQFSDVRYICCTVGNGLHLNKDGYNKTYGRGFVYQKYKRKDLESGGGKIYIEAFHENEEPQLKPPYGLYLSALGKPQILKTIWSDCDFNPIKGAVKFGSTVLLHIYTCNLYGQELFVELWDRDLLSGNDILGTTDHNMEEINPETSGEIYYKRTCEVNVYEKKEFLDPTEGIVQGGLENITTHESNKYVQKAIMRVDIGYNWIAEGGNDLKVFSVIADASIALSKVSDSRNYLEVNNNGKSYSRPSNLSVGKIGQVNTNVGLFRPCGYYIVTAKEGDRESSLYNQYVGEIKKDFELVAGNALKEVTVKLDEKASTTDCMSFGLQKGDLHTGNVFSVGENILPDAPPKQKNPYAPAKTESETKRSTELGKASVEMESGGDDAETPYVVSKTDKELTVGVNFNYDKTPWISNTFTTIGLPYILRYFWFSESSTTKYDIHIHSCRHPDHKFQLKVYPDVKWMLQLIFTNTSKEITVASSLAKKYREGMTFVEDSDEKRKFELGLAAEFNNGDKMDLANEFMDTIKKTTGALKQIMDFIENTILGKNNSSDGDYAEPTEDQRAAAEEARRRAEVEQRNKSQKEIDKINKEEEERIKKLEKRKQHLDSLKAKANDPNKTDAQREAAKRDLKKEYARTAEENKGMLRRVVGIDIDWPQFNLGFGWQMAAINSPNFKDLANTTGMELEGFIKFDPLIKVDIFLDFLALAQRSHPLVLAVIAGLDIGLALFGDGSRMVAELRLSTEIGGEVEGTINTKTGENTFDKEDSEFAKIEGSAKLSLTIGVYLQTESRSTYIWIGKASVKLEANAEFKAEAAFTAKSSIGTDKEGFYFSPILQFDGITIEGSVSAEGKGEIGDLSISGSYEGKITYQAIDEQPPKEYGKLYFKNT